VQPIEDAVFRTILYADVFSFALTPREIHHFLIADAPLGIETVERALTGLAAAQRIARHDDLITVYGRDYLAEVRRQREAIALTQWRQAQRYGAWLSRLPYIRMVALTGSLAMHNSSSAQDDLDYVLVIAPGRVWLARLLAIGVVRLARLHGVTICPNYVLAETALAQDRRDLFIAHEVVQMVPLFGFGLYHTMRQVNSWVSDHLPNAHGAYYPEREYQPEALWRVIKRAGEWLLGGAVGDRLERWEYRRKHARFARQIHHTSAARIDPENVKGHFEDHGVRVLREYHARLAAWGLHADSSSSSLPLAGD
jgi:hypothetical protein